MTPNYFIYKNKKGKTCQIHLFGDPACLTSRLKAQGATNISHVTFVHEPFNKDYWK